MYSGSFFDGFCPRSRTEGIMGLQNSGFDAETVIAAPENTARDPLAEYGPGVASASRPGGAATMPPPTATGDSARVQGRGLAFILPRTLHGPVALGDHAPHHRAQGFVRVAGHSAEQCFGRAASCFRDVARHGPGSCRRPWQPGPAPRRTSCIALVV